jgi:hypothetical protein
MKINTSLNIGDLVEYKNEKTKYGRIVGYQIEYSVDRDFFKFYYEVNSGDPEMNYLVRYDLLKKRCNKDYL